MSQQLHIMLHRALKKWAAFACACCWWVSAEAKGPGDEVPILYETSVFLMVQGLGGVEIPALVNNDTAYLSVTDVFEFLKIRHTTAPGRDSVTGYFIQESNPYLIDLPGGRIHFKGQHFLLRPYDLLRAETGIYLRLDYFGSVFGLPATFNFRNLSVSMTATMEMPAMTEMRRQLMRQNLRQLRGDLKADTVIKRAKAFFRFGMADWSVLASQRNPGGNDLWVNLRAGAHLAGGEATVSLNYNKYAYQPIPGNDKERPAGPFDPRRQYYMWRYVDNDRPLMRQFIAGKISANSISSIFDPVVGVQVTNAPTTYRRSYGTYTLTNRTEPNWTVELYVNNALVDYTTADANGLYSFQVPLVYGNSQIRLRFFGPWGEERLMEENVRVPFNFLPYKEFEYTASAGFLEDSVNSFFTRVQSGYGLTRFITMGAGLEYKSSIPGANTIPFVNTSFRLAKSLLLSGEYAHGVRGKGLLSWRLPANFQLDAEYIRYKKGQRAIIYNFREERKLMLAKPVFTKRFSMFTRLTFNQLVSQYSRYSTTDLLLSGAIGRVGTSIATYAVFVRDTDPFVYTTLGLTFRLPGNMIVMPQLQYAYTGNELMSARCEVGKYVFRRGYFNVAYEENLRSKIRQFQVGLRWDFSFGQLGFSVLTGNRNTTTVQSARGSFVHEGKTGYTAFSNRSQVGTGGLLVYAFLDVNGNGRRDAGEQRLNGLRLHVNGGRLIPRAEDTAVCIMEMEPYVHYFLDLGKSSFDNIAWKIRHPVVKVMAEPNQVRLVEVPVVVVGEISGHVILQEPDKRKGLGRIRVQVLRQDGSVAASIVSEPDGFFNYLGLPPGDYIVSPDTGQLKKLGLSATPASFPIHIRATPDGDVVEKLKFVLQRISESAVRF